MYGIAAYYAWVWPRRTSGHSSTLLNLCTCTSCCFYYFCICIGWTDSIDGSYILWKNYFSEGVTVPRCRSKSAGQCKKINTAESIYIAYIVSCGFQRFTIFFMRFMNFSGEVHTVYCCKWFIYSTHVCMAIMI